MQQKFKWYKSTEQLPDNQQHTILVSYIDNVGGRDIRFVHPYLYFDPRFIVDGKLKYAGLECDYWSPLPNLPKEAELNQINDIPAISLKLE